MNSQVIVKPSLTLNIRDERWIAFVKGNTTANIFHHPAWSQLLVECYNYKPIVVIVLNEDGEICAGLPLMQIHSLITGRRWVSLPFSDNCLPLYVDDQAFIQLTDKLVFLFEGQKLPSVELRWKYPSHATIMRTSHEVLHTIYLKPDAELMLSHLHKMHQRNINKAQKEGLRVERCTTKGAMDVFYNLHLQTRQRQGIPIQPKKFFDLLCKNIIERGLGFVLLAYKDNECIAGSVFLHWQQTLTYKYGASNETGRNLRANHMIMWSAIRWGCENGYKLFDMGKTENQNTGLRQFKSMWGAVEQPLIYSIISSNLPRSGNGRLKDLMQTVIRRSPPWVCRLTGELLYRHFG